MSRETLSQSKIKNELRLLHNKLDEVERFVTSLVYKNNIEIKINKHYKLSFEYNNSSQGKIYLNEILFSDLNFKEMKLVFEYIHKVIEEGQESLEQVQKETKEIIKLADELLVFNTGKKND